MSCDRHQSPERFAPDRLFGVSMDDEVAIEVRGLQKHFRRTAALSHGGLVVRRGEMGVPRPLL
jgi:hypothetical protein